jgi:D-glycero-alpha-D-manno-heptose-7-phosphate kinase
VLTGGLPSVRVAAPCRADLAGGTLDIWPLGLLHDGALTVNMALETSVELEVRLGGERGVVHHIGPDSHPSTLHPDDAATDLTAAVVLAMVPEGGVTVRVERQPPMGSGLGGSSSYGVALVRALGECLGAVPTETETAALVRDLEARVLGTPTGEQDHWAAIRGGVLALFLEPGGPRVEAIDVEPDWIASRVTVFFTGIRHHSGMVNWEVVRRRLDADPATIAACDEIATAARLCRDGLTAADEDSVAVAIRRDWAARRMLAAEVSPPEVDELIDAATAAGAAAVKACGAGGGGSLLLWHPPEHRASIVRRLERSCDQGRVLAAGVAPAGCRTISGS